MNTTPHGPCKDAFDQWIDGREFPGLNCAPMDSDLYTVFHAGWIAALRSSTGHAVATQVQSQVQSQVESIWAAWPVKKARGAAIPAINRALKKVDFFVLLAAVEHLAKEYAKWPEAEKKYLPMCSTYMNQERWLDPKETWVRGASATPSQFSKIQ